jgi:hypothetical protein
LTASRRETRRSKTFGPLAQVVEQRPFKAWVVGSSPARLNIVRKEVKMAARLWIKDVIEGYFDFTGKIEDLMKRLADIKSEHPDHKDFEIESEWGGNDGPDIFNLIAYRLETDKEFEKRIKAKKAQREKKASEKAKAEAEERELYEDLKKKFEK